MDKSFTVYGAAGSGSVPVEAALTLLGLPYQVVEGATWSFDPEVLERVRAVNPLVQIPTLVLPNDEIMTESAAMLVWLADSHPAVGLSPAVDDPRRAAFLRWMTFIPASIYSLYWLRDDPSRIARDPADHAFVKQATADRIADCWAIMDSQLSPGRYLLGDQMTVLDLYVTVVSRWGPRRKVFYERAPKMAQVVRRVDADPRLADFWAARFPFEDGWEG
ncbi:MAG: glutathione S-transferase family protein [Caulobacter sp.]|nr:glutathione S-transferase family protein [Caulobacter sp.]